MSLARYLAIIRTFKIDEDKFFDISINKFMLIFAYPISFLFEIKYKLQLYKEGV